MRRTHHPLLFSPLLTHTTSGPHGSYPTRGRNRSNR